MSFRYVLFVWLAGQLFIMGVIIGFGGPEHFPDWIGHTYGNGIGIMDAAVLVIWLILRFKSVRL